MSVIFSIRVVVYALDKVLPSLSEDIELAGPGECLAWRQRQNPADEGFSRYTADGAGQIEGDPVSGAVAGPGLRLRRLARYRVEEPGCRRVVEKRARQHLRLL